MLRRQAKSKPRAYNGGNLPTFSQLLNSKWMEHILHGGAINHDHPVIFSANKKIKRRCEKLPSIHCKSFIWEHIKATNWPKMLTKRLSVWRLLRPNRSTQSELFPGRNPQAAQPTFDIVYGKPVGDQYQRVPPGGTRQWQGLGTKGTSALGPPCPRCMVGFRKSRDSPQSRFISTCVFMEGRRSGVCLRLLRKYWGH